MFLTPLVTIPVKDSMEAQRNLHGAVWLGSCSSAGSVGMLPWTGTAGSASSLAACRCHWGLPQPALLHSASCQTGHGGYEHVY